MIKKKGRKPKSYYENLKNTNNTDTNNTDTNTNSTNTTNTTNNNTIDISNNEKVLKKRGRKPKGGKIIEAKNKLDIKYVVPNIILHLNCQNNDLINNIKYDPNIYDPNVNSINNFNIDNSKLLNYDYLYNNQENVNDNVDENIDKNLNIDNNVNHDENLENENVQNKTLENESRVYQENIYKENSKYIKQDEPLENNIQIVKINNNENFLNREITKKLDEQSNNLKNSNINKKSACFWCTYDFDNNPVLIPKYELKNVFYCYGNFCSPECACSYLINENIDSSSKFERYYLLNNIYSKIYNYDKNIKFAPNPYYLLDKFYGNLSIQEYRQLLKNERFLIIVDKPISKLLPELYEENKDFLLNDKAINKNKNNYKMKGKK